jgi:CRP-like cAMP-binding protein
MLVDELKAILAIRGWLAGLDEDFQTRILSPGRVLSLPRGKSLYAAGDEPGGVYGILSGGIMMSAPGRDGLPLAGHILRRGAWFGHGPLMTKRRRVLSAEASEPSRVLQVPLGAIERIIAADPAAARYVGAIADYNHDILIKTCADLLIRETDRRIAAVLLRITAAEDGVQPDDPRGFPLTQQLIGEMSNTSRDTVNRVLSDFANRQWISWRYGRANVLDVQALAAFAAGAAVPLPGRGRDSFGTAGRRAACRRGEGGRAGP